MAAPVVWFVGAGPGDPDLITMKGNELLVTADLLIYAGSLVNPALVERSGAKEKLDSWGMSIEEMVPIMVDAARAGKKVVRLHSGDPRSTVRWWSDRRAGEAWGRGHIVPGVSSLFAASAALKTQYTLKGVSETRSSPGRPARHWRGRHLQTVRAGRVHGVLPRRKGWRRSSETAVLRTPPQRLSIMPPGLTRG